ncbi:MAG: hypothetical protein KDC83_12500 [Flavobacteriales bacterium]|nr:hypothetical protein [Flavobacteriales bacterium]
MRNPILNYFVRFIIGGFFIFSGVVKLYPVESFELTLVETGVIPWAVSDWTARLIIAMELFLGAGLFINSKWLPRIIRSTILLTIFFSVYLIILWYNKGGEVDCGCLGGALTLTPSQSLIKNALIIVLLVFSLFGATPYLRRYRLVFFLLVGSAITAPFVLNPIHFDRTIPGEESFPFRLELEKFPSHVIADIPFDVNSERYILAFMSTTCSHCRLAAKKLHLANAKMELPPIHILFVGPKEEYPEFQKESRSAFGYTFFGDKTFFEFCNGTLPTLLYINDGQVWNKWQGNDINHEALNWIEEQSKSKN